MFLSWRSGDVRAYGVSGDDPRKGRFYGSAKRLARSKPQYSGAHFHSEGDFWSVFGRFLVGLGPVRVDFSSVDFGRIFSTVWTSILGTSVPGCSLTLNAVYIDVSGRLGLVFEDSVNSGLKCPFSQCPPC
jgi:hypothetical protein